METTIHLKSSANVNYSNSVNIQKETSSYEKFIKNLEFSYFGLISMTILIGSIFGGIAASFILSNEAPIWELCLCAAVSMASNTAGIGQAPTKWVFNLFIFGLITNLTLILVNL